MDCASTRDAITTYVDPTIDKKPATEVVETAAKHIRFCKDCRAEIGSEVRGRFIHSLVIDRE